MANSQQQPFAYPISSPYPPAESSQAATPAQASTSTAAAGAAAPTQSRQAAEEARKDRTLADFMLMLDDYEPLVRDALIVRVGWC